MTQNAFKKHREEYEVKAGGKDAIEWTGEWREVGENGKCVCGQTTYTIFQVRSKVNHLLHWLGTTCITYYTGQECFGGYNDEYGRSPIKQGSYKQLIKGYAVYVKGNSTAGREEILRRLIDRCKTHKTGMYITEGEKKVMEQQMHMDIIYHGLTWDEVKDKNGKY